MEILATRIYIYIYISQESTVKFHIVGLKCVNCGSYNTCRIKGSPSPGDACNY